MSLTPFVMPKRNIEEAFWRFASMRQAVWAGDEPDEKMKVWHVHNLYRELDYGTRYVDTHIRNTDAPGFVKVAWIIAYRILNNIDTFEAIQTHVAAGVQYPKSTFHFDIEIALREMSIMGYTAAGSVNLSARIQDLGGVDKLADYVIAISNAAREARNLYQTADAVDLPGLVATIADVPGVTTHVAAQVALDMILPGFTASKPIATRAFAYQSRFVSPFAKKILAEMGVVGNDATMLRAVKSLCERQHIVLEALDLPFDWPINSWVADDTTLDIPNIVHSLDAYYRYKSAGVVRSLSRRYVPSAELEHIRVHGIKD